MAYHEKPIERRYQTIFEVMRCLHVSASCIRYWEKEFGIKVRSSQSRKNQAKRRQFNAENIQDLRVIKHFLHVEGRSVSDTKVLRKEDLRKVGYLMSIPDGA